MKPGDLEDGDYAAIVTKATTGYLNYAPRNGEPTRRELKVGERCRLWIAHAMWGHSEFSLIPSDGYVGHAREGNFRLLGPLELLAEQA